MQIKKEREILVDIKFKNKITQLTDEKSTQVHAL